MKKLSHIEEQFALFVKLFRLPKPEREYRFDSVRRWRFDFAWPAKKVAVECEGGHWSGGRHVRGSGFEKDAEKYNRAALLGWRVLRFTATMLKDTACMEQVKEALQA